MMSLGSLMELCSRAAVAHGTSTCAMASPGVALGIGAVWLGVSVCTCLKPFVSSVSFPSERLRSALAQAPALKQGCR
jgi:hypothetical protein